MKYLKVYESYQSDEEIHKICREYSIKKYTIVDGKVNVDDDVYLSHSRLTKIPLLFGVVTGYFSCSGNYLKSLEGAPTSVGGNFDCSGNDLTSLEYCPKSVGGGFNCSYNELVTLKGSPKNITGDFTCGENYLTSLEGAPTSVGGNFNFRSNKVIDLIGINKVGGYLDCFDNPIAELWKYIGKSKIELFNYFDPIRPPEKEGEEPIIYLAVFNSYLELLSLNLQIEEEPVTTVKGYKCL